MFEKLLVVILQGKGALAAGLLVVGSTGFLVGGTVDGRSFNFSVRPIENTVCVQAMLARSDALEALDEKYEVMRGRLQHLRELARERAHDQHKQIDEFGLSFEYQRTLDALRAERDESRAAIFEAADLSACDDGNPDTGVVLDIAELRQKYAAILAAAGSDFDAALGKARTAFDTLVKNAKPRPAGQCHDSGSSDSGDSRD